MDNFWYWLLLAPVALFAVLYAVGFLVGGAAVIWSAKGVRMPEQKVLLVGLGLLVVVAPYLHLQWSDARELTRALTRLERLAAMERVTLTDRMPRTILLVGLSDRPRVRAEAARQGLRLFPDAEAERLSSTYRRYRRREFCHRTSGGETWRGTAIPVCRAIPDRVQDALGVSEPILVLASGIATSYRQSNTMAGRMYELRLITPHRDALVDYYEELVVRVPRHPFRAFSSGWRNVSDGPVLHAEAFLARAMKSVHR